MNLDPQTALRFAYRRRAAALDWPMADEHEDAVVGWALAALRGEREAPRLHPHAFEEAGMCVECDAAALLESVNDEIAPKGERYG